MSRILFPGLDHADVQHDDCERSDDSGDTDDGQHAEVLQLHVLHRVRYPIGNPSG
jgi:hypothetical protein